MKTCDTGSWFLLLCCDIKEWCRTGDSSRVNPVLGFQSIVMNWLLGTAYTVPQHTELASCGRGQPTVDGTIWSNSQTHICRLSSNAAITAIHFQNKFYCCGVSVLPKAFCSICEAKLFYLKTWTEVESDQEGLVCMKKSPRRSSIISVMKLNGGV